jgi:hypothetical protein
VLLESYLHQGSCCDKFSLTLDSLIPIFIFLSIYGKFRRSRQTETDFRRKENHCHGRGRIAE